jgi:hypothetical protein
MTQCTELWIDRNQIRSSKIVTSDIAPLEQDEVLVAIDKFALTANNVSYAVIGDMIGYWGYYPAQGGWGKVPVWGCANVIESNCGDIPVGERLWGFFPMASHAVLRPGKIHDEHFSDISEHRKDLPALYNSYQRTQAEPEFLRDMEDQRCLLFPLFATSYLLYDYLLDNEFFGARQVLIGSVSSKTGFGLAHMLHNDPSAEVRVIGLTSASNVEFVRSIDCCDDIVVYGEENQIDGSIPSAYVDMSGDARLTTALHKHVGDNMVESAMVGASHWEAMGDTGELPGAKPTFFFAPGQIAKRNQEWGPGVAMRKAQLASAEVAKAVQGDMAVKWINGAEDLADHWLLLLDNKIPPSTGLMVSLL